jgi:hypothetical protein
MWFFVYIMDAAHLYCILHLIGRQTEDRGFVTIYCMYESGPSLYVL